MIKHTVTIQIEDVENDEIRIRASCDPVPNDQTVVTSALACAAEILELLKAKSQPPAQGAAPVEDAKPYVAEGRFDADPGSFVPKEKPEEQT